MLWHFLVKWRFKALTQDAVIVVWCRLMASGKWSTCPKRNACRVRTCSPPRQRGHRKSPIRSPIHFTKITILMICWWCFRFLLYIVMVLVSLLFSFDFEHEWDIRDIMTHYIVLKKNRWWASELVAVILRQYHKRTTQETTSWYYLSIHFRPATESRCLCRKKAWRKSQAPCWSQDRAPGKHHEISWLNYHDRPSWDVTRLHESVPKLEESMSKHVPIFFR